MSLDNELVPVVDDKGSRKYLPASQASNPDVIALGFRPLNDILPKMTAPLHDEGNDTEGEEASIESHTKGKPGRKPKQLQA